MAAPLAITLGDPAGVGPAIVADAWSALPESVRGRLICIGAADALAAHRPDIPLARVPDLEAVIPNSGQLSIVDCPTSEPVVPGTPSSSHAGSIITSLERATAAAADNSIAGLITAPINKALLYGAGFEFAGHTEYLADRAGLAADEVAMMLAGPSLRVVPMTIHIPLSAVSTTLTSELIVRQALITARDLRKRFGVAEPRLVIAGLNPHAGESGAIGHEEATHIQPAIWQLQDMGLTIEGPLPADTLFHADARASYDAVLCCYHDQALVPIKTLHFWDGVNVTLGLPYVRTSPDHGTAYGAAGNGSARADSMLAAIRMALDLTGGLDQ